MIGRIIFLVAAIAASARAAAPVPLDERQREIVRIVVDEVIERIKGLNARRDDLEKFGDPPYFTRGDGELHYLSPGKGVGIYFRLKPVGAPDSPLSSRYRVKSMGGARAGISHELCISVQPDLRDDGNQPALESELQEAVRDVLDTTFEKLCAEYWLDRRGLQTDTAALLALVTDREPDVAGNALTVLRFRELGERQLETIRESVASGECPLPALFRAIDVVEKQDAAHLPEFYGAVLARAIRAEKEGGDVFHKTPFWGSGWESGARMIRRSVIVKIRKSADPRFLAPARAVLSEDPVTEHRLMAVEYMGDLSGEEATAALMEALRNPHRSVQAKAAELVGNKKIESAVPALEKLLVSHSLRVRASAATALEQLGRSNAGSARSQPLGRAAREMAATLWARGLEDRDIIDTCGHPGTVSHLPEGREPAAAVPPGVDRDEHVARLSDPWRMKTMDEESVRKRAAQYAAGVGSSGIHLRLDATGPFLLAAALKLEDEETASLIYERMCEEFETDEEALERGITVLAWNRFLAGLDHFQRKQDAKALAAFRSVVSFEDFAAPHSVLDACTKQSRELVPEVSARLKSEPRKEPARKDRNAYIEYWISRIKEINGVMPGQPASPAIWYEQASFSDIPIPPFASDKLREVGLDALPKLIEAMDDQTPTRTVGYWRDFHPSRYIVTVGSAAREIFATICFDHGLLPPESLESTQSPAEKLSIEKIQAELGEWVLRLPKDAKRLTEEERRTFMRTQFPPKPFIDAP